MPQMNPAAARVIDPVLTEVARGYRSNRAPVADLLFPIVNVAQRGGTIINFGPDGYKLYNTARAPGTNVKRVQFGYGKGNFALVDYGLEGAVPIQLMEEADAVPGIDLGSMAVRTVQDLQALEREKQCADLALNLGAYAASNRTTLSGTSQWNDSTSDPFTLVADAREAVRAQIGMRPDSMVVGPKVRTALAKHPKVLDRLRGGKGADGADRPPATLQDLSALFEMVVVEGGMNFHDGTQFQDVWGKHAVLAYTAPGAAREMGSPNYGYTYRLTNRPVVEEPYFDRNAETWFYPVKDARQPVLVGASAGYFIQNAVA